MSLLDAFLLEPANCDLWLACRQDGAKGSGTASDPYNGSPGRFDDLMKEIVQRFPNGGTRIHLGPGTFETNGFDDQNAANCWQAQAFTRIIGSGMGATTLKLVNANAEHHQYFAIGHALTTKVDFFEVAELTIDCNLINSGGNGNVSCGAVRIMGDHARIRRVKAIQWGTKTDKNCVVLSAICASTEGGGAEAIDVGVEDCIVVSPGTSTGTSYPITAIHAGGLEVGVTNAGKFGRAPLIRNCYVDMGQTAPATLATRYRGLSMSWCIGGVVHGNQVHNADVGGPYLELNSARDMVIRNNFLKNVMRGVYLNAGSIPASALGTGRSFSWAGGVATVSLASVSDLSVGDRVKLQSADPTTFNGVYEVIGVQPSGPQFTIATPVSGSGSGTVTVFKVVNVKRAVIEGNTVELCTGVSGVTGIAVVDRNDSSPYSEPPDFVNGDIVVMNNKIRYTDGATPTGASDVAIDLRGTRRAIVNNNIVDSANAHPLQARRWGTVRFFNNQTEAGEYRPGVISDVGETQDDLAELAQEADDALVLAYLER